MSILINSVGKIECLDKKGEILSQGTGFFYSVPTGKLTFSNYDQSLLCFITCKHVLDEDPFQYRITIQSIANMFDPVVEELVFDLNEIIVVDHPEVDLTMLHIKTVDLKSSIGFELPNFLKYEKYNKHIRHSYVSEFFNFFNNSIVASTKFQISNNQALNIPGYHLGEDSHNFNIPLNVTGFIISDPIKDIFVAQAPINYGSSGSPIFVSYINTQNNLLTFYLLGVVSEAVVDSNGNFTGLLYGLSARHIYLLEQLLIAKLNKNI